MRDYLFEEILDRRANVTRPSVRVDQELLAHEPEYALIEAAVPLRLRPLRATLDATLLGAFPRAGAVAYAASGDLRAQDRIGVIQGLTTLRADAGEDSRELEVANPESLAPGQRLHLREAEACVEGRVAEVAGSTVRLREPLAMGFRAGANVERIESWEVLGVEEAGSGHHLRVALRRRV